MITLIVLSVWFGCGLLSSICLFIEKWFVWKEDIMGEDILFILPFIIFGIPGFILILIYFAYTRTEQHIEKFKSRLIFRNNREVS